jgi:ATP-binding cassette, subfamily C, bacterial
MRQIFNIFFKAEGTRPILVLFCLLVGGLAEAIGIGTLLPITSAVLNPTGNNPSIFERAIRDGFAYVGVEPSFTNLILLIMSIMTVRSVLLFSALSYAGITSARVANAFRSRLIRAILEARWSFYANQSGGQVATTLSNDVSRAGEAYLTFATAAACWVQILAYAAIAALINWRVAAAGILGGLLVALLSSRLVNISRRSGFKQSDRLGTMTTDIVEMLHNMKALKSMYRYGPLLVHMDDVLERLKKSLYTASLSRYGLTYGNDLLVSLLIGGGAYFAHIKAGVSIPELFVFGVLFFQVVSYASKLQKQIQIAAQYEGAYVRVSQALALAQSEKEINQGSLLPDIGKHIAFENVVFSHTEQPVLKGLNIEIPANAITVIQGASGAGKTTLLDLLVGLLRPQAGVVRVGNTSLQELDVVKWRQLIGYVPQELSLFHDSIRSNITLYDETVDDAAVEESLRLSGVQAFVHQLPNGINTDVGEFGGKLSGGQRQRISLARALVTGPKILILDEVTSALDPETENAIVNNIAELRGRYTIVAITHRPAWTRIADRLYTLKDGKAELQTAHRGKRK